MIALARCFHQKHPILDFVFESEEESAANTEEPPFTRFVAFVDMGHTSTSVTLVAFTCKFSFIYMYK
jgi:hypothetical protein